MSAAGDTAQELSIAKAEIRRLRTALESIADLSCRTTKKAEQCEHGVYGYEHCENCIAEFAATVLKGTLGQCCYGGIKSKKDCASCADWRGA